MAPIGIALIGGGIFIKEAHIPAVLATPTLQVKAIYSRTLKSAKDSKALLPDSGAGVDLYSDETGGGYAEVLKRDDISGIIVALPIANQPEYIKAALDAGKHVLAEKPVAPDVARGRELIDYYHAARARTGATWSCAEQIRCMPNYISGAAEARKLGRVTGFRAIVDFLMKEDNPYFNTAWRKQPTHDYGFLLDAGVHWVAALRMLIGGDDVAETVSGFSHTATKHLPPPDSLQGVVRTRSGVAGAFLASCGSNFQPRSEFSVACERGSVTVSRDTITVTDNDGKQRVSEVDASAGVTYEVQAWAAALEAGKPDPRLAPEEGLADVEFLLGLLISADQGGAPQTLSLQQVQTRAS